jgi:hypothetical protein
VSCDYKNPSAGIDVSCYQPSIQQLFLKGHHYMNRANATYAEVKCRRTSPAIVVNLTPDGVPGSSSHLQV